MIPLHRRLTEIELEEGPRAAAIADELTVDGWDPLLHIEAAMDPAVTERPLPYTEAALHMTAYYRWYASWYLDERNFR